MARRISKAGTEGGVDGPALLLSEDDESLMAEIAAALASTLEWLE